LAGKKITLSERSDLSFERVKESVSFLGPCKLVSDYAPEERGKPTEILNLEVVLLLQNY
jgi:hypothetical protein